MAKCHTLEFALAVSQIQNFIDTSVANTDRSASSCLSFEFLSNVLGPAGPFDAFLYLKPRRIFL